MNLLDENIPLDQRDLLHSWGIPCRAIGQDVAELSITDENILPLLHRLKHPTLFTRDGDFFRQQLSHPGYCLAFLDVQPVESAAFVRRFLRCPSFNSKALRRGIVARLHHDGVDFWTSSHGSPRKLHWPV